MAGLASILQLRDNALKVKSGIQEGYWPKEIIEKNEAEICDLNSNDQLFQKGQNALGVDIMDYMPYAPLTVRIKEMKNQPWDRVTLKDTGDFHASFVLRADNDGFEIDATDWKRDELVDKYGKQIFGLNDENKSYVAREILLPELIERIRQTL